MANIKSAKKRIKVTEVKTNHNKMIKSALTKNRFVIRYGKLISYDIHDNKEYHDCRLEDIISKEEKDGKWHILKGSRF